LPRLALNSWSSYLLLLSRWDYRCILSYPAKLHLILENSSSQLFSPQKPFTSWKLRTTPGAGSTVQW
jgi:hypothetical protein